MAWRARPWASGQSALGLVQAELAILSPACPGAGSLGRGDGSRSLFAVGGSTGWDCAFPAASERHPGPPASSEGSHVGSVCASTLDFWSGEMICCSLFPSSTENTPMIAGLGQVSRGWSPWGVVWQSQHRDGHLHSLVIRSDKLGVQEGG